VYRGETKHPLEPVGRLLDRASQATRTLARYRNRLDVETAVLSRHEIDDLVTVRDVATVLQRCEMLRRIADELARTILELGSAGRVGSHAQPPLTVRVRPRGYRLLGRVPRLSDGVIDHVVDHFGSLSQVLDASVSELTAVEGVGEVRARAIRDGLGRVVEAVTA